MVQGRLIPHLGSTTHQPTGMRLLWAALLCVGAVHCGGKNAAEEAAAGDAPCRPRAASGPLWLAEQETIVIDLECESGAALPGEAIVVHDLPPNASYDPSRRQLTFSPELDQAGVYDFAIGVFGSNELGHVEVQVADRFDAKGNVPPDPATYTEEYGLPVVHLGRETPLSGEEYTPAIITYRGKTYQGTQAKYRGAHSSHYPKRSFTLKFAKHDQFEDPRSAPGFVRKRKVILTSTFDDSSYLRARLAFELWGRLSAEQIQVQTFSVVLYIDGSFHGLYTLADKVDGNLMEDSGLFEGGNLYKARTHDANFRLTRHTDPARQKRSLSEGLTKEEGSPAAGEPGASDDLKRLVRWVATSSRESFVAKLGSYLDRSDYEGWWMLVSMLDAGDSAGKNSYHYRDPRRGAPDGRFRVLPWDFNHSFGQDWKTERQAATRDPEELNAWNELFTRMLREPETRGPLLDRLHSVLGNEWELESVLEVFDTWAEEIHQVARRDESLWRGQMNELYPERQDSPSYEKETAYTRQWIIERWSFVRSHFWPGAVQ
jgi:spore coat protein H